MKVKILDRVQRGAMCLAEGTGTYSPVAVQGADCPFMCDDIYLFFIP